MGLRVTVVIECDEANEIVQHLDHLKKEIRKEYTKHPEIFDKTGFIKSFTDNNCYGEHQCNIESID